MAIFYFHLCICTDLSTDTYREPCANNDFHYRTSDLCLISTDIYQQAKQFIEEIQYLSSMDHLIIKLVILILIFTKGSDLNESIWLQTDQIYHAQNIYVQLLWNYLHGRFGIEQTTSRFSRLIFSCMKAQVLARQTKEIVNKQVLTHQHFAPLMQSVLLVS
jgi:hypothetical protein